MTQGRPDDIEIYKRILTSARPDVQSILAAVDKLKNLTNQSSLDRSSIRLTLLDLKAAVEAGKWTAAGAILALSSLGQLGATDQPSKEQIGTQIGQFFSGLTKAIDNVISTVDNSRPSDENTIRQAVTALYWPYVDFGILFGKINIVLDLDPMGGLAWISRLVAIDSLSLDERWATATCYLTALEIAVNRAVKSLGIDASEIEEFHDKFSKVLVILGKKGRPVTGLSRMLPPAFWKLRNDVVHTGYSPTAQEMEIIIPWVREAIKAVSEPSK
jgi:hypothetical protein